MLQINKEEYKNIFEVSPTVIGYHMTMGSLDF